MKNKKIFQELRLVFKDPEPAPAPERPEGPGEKPDAKEKPGEKKAETIKDSKEALTSFRAQIPQMAVAIRAKRILAYKWKRDSAKAVEEMWTDWRDHLKLPVGTKFYTDLKAQLMKPFDPKVGEGATIDARDAETPSNIDYYTNPFVPEHEDWLDKNDSKYLEAIRFVEEVKKLLIDQLKSSESIAESKRDLESDPVFKTVTDGAKNVGKDISRAWREKDYGSLALYGFGAWTLWSAADKLKGAGGGKYMDYLMYAGAAYTGYHILGRAGFDVGKATGFVAKDADVRGTVYAHLTSAGIEGEGAMDAGLLLALSDVSVKSMYDQYKKAGSEAFIHPQQFPRAFGALRHARPRDINNPRTPDQEFYVETGKKLFMLMESVVTMYDEIPAEMRKGKTFEEQFSNREMLFKDLGFFYSQYFDLQRREDWYSKLEGTGFDRASKDLSVLIDKIPYTLDEPLGGGHVKGMIMGFPVVFVPSDDRKTYRIKLFSAYLSDKAAQSIADVPMAAGRAQETALSKVKGKIENEMTLLVSKLAIDASGKSPDVQFDGANWVAKIKRAGPGGVPKETTVYFRPLPNGQGVDVEFDGEKMPINLAIEKDQPPAKVEALRELYLNSDYKETLLPFVRMGQLRINGPIAEDKSFKLIVANLAKYPLTVEMKEVPLDPKNPSKTVKKYVIEEDSMKRLMESYDFSNAYADAVDKSSEVEDTFKRFKGVLDGAPESFVWHLIKSVPGWVSGATGASLLRGLDLSDFTGSIKGEQAKAILDAKRRMMRDRLAADIRKATSFAQVVDKRRYTYDPGLLQLNYLTDKFHTKNIEKRNGGKDWTDVEFTREIMNPLFQDVGVRTRAYGEGLKRFTTDIYSLVYNDSDLVAQPHMNASKVLSVYTYNTSSLDEDLDGLHRDLLGKPLDIDDPEKLDKLEKDSDPKAQEKLKEQKRLKEQRDQAITGTRRLNYMAWVHERLIGVAQRKGKNVMNAAVEDFGFWEIEPFETWVKNPANATVASLDIRDTRPPLEHDPVGFEEYYALKAKQTAGTPPLTAEEEAKLKKSPTFRGDVFPSYDATKHGTVTEFDRNVGEAIKKKTQLEEEYVKTFDRYINALIAQYQDSDDLNVEKVLEFRDNYLNAMMIYSDSGGIVDETQYPTRDAAEASKDVTLRTNPNYVSAFVAPEYWRDFRDVNASLSLASNVTKSLQLQMIHDRVKAVIETEIFSASGEREYFVDIPFMTQAKAWWRNLEDLF